MKNFLDAKNFMKKSSLPTGIMTLSAELERVFDEDALFWNAAERTLEMIHYPGLTPNQQADIIVDCAFQIARKRFYDRSEKLLYEAELGYSSIMNLHNIFIVKWMRGALLWQIADSNEKAIVQWDRAIELVKRILRDQPLMLDRSEYYSYRIHLAEMEKAISAAVKENGLELQLFEEAE